MNYCKMENLKEFSLEFLKRKKVLVLVIITVFFKVLQTFNLWVKVTWNLIIYILIHFPVWNGDVPKYNNNKKTK